MGYGRPMSLAVPARPWWMTAMAVVCFLVLAISIPRDLFFPDSRDVEVWFGGRGGSTGREHQSTAFTHG